RKRPTTDESMAVVTVGRFDRTRLHHVAAEGLREEGERRHLQVGAAAGIDLLKGHDVGVVAAHQFDDRPEIVAAAAADAAMDVPGEDAHDAGRVVHRRRALARASSGCSAMDSPIQATATATRTPTSKRVGPARMRASWSPSSDMAASPGAR